MLSGVQGAKMARLHIKETPENFSEVVGIPITGGDGYFVDVHRGQEQQVLRVFHPGPVDAIRGVATVGLPVYPPKVVRVAMEFPGDQGRGERFSKVAGNERLSLDRKVFRLSRCRKMRAVLQSDLQ